MKTLKKILLGTALMAGISMAAPRTLEAQTDGEKPIITLNQSALTRYLAFGFPFSEGFSYQQGVGVDYKGLNFSAVGNMDFAQGRVNDAEAYFSYAKNFGKLGTTIGTGASTFVVDGEWQKCAEIYSGLSLSAPLNPSVTAYKYFGLSDGKMVDFGLSQDIPLSKSVTLSPSAQMGFNDKAFRERSDFDYFNLNLELPIKVGENGTVIPRVSFTQALAPDITTRFSAGVILTTNLNINPSK